MTEIEVLKKMASEGMGVWEFKQCGLGPIESKSVVGFRVAIPHWSDPEGDDCHQRVVDLVHAS